VRCVANSTYPVEMMVNLAVFLSLRLLVLTIRQPFSKPAMIERVLIYEQESCPTYCDEDDTEIECDECRGACLTDDSSSRPRYISPRS